MGRIRAIDSGRATLYGILIGDGCISRSCNHYFVVVTCSIYDDVEFFEHVVVPLMEKARGKAVTYLRRPKYGKVEINFSDKKLFGEIRDMGFPVGLKGEMPIPQTIPMKLWKYVISGIFATDGSLALVNNNGTLYPRVEFRTNSRTLARQIQDFLLLEGIRGNCYCIKNKGGYKPTFRLEIPGKKNLVKFEKLIGFINPKQRKKFERYLELTLN